MYQSLTMGNVVHTRLEVIAQMLESLLRFHTFDFKWIKINP